LRSPADGNEAGYSVYASRGRLCYDGRKRPQELI
jgi:hypothetical protein